MQTTTTNNETKTTTIDARQVEGVLKQNMAAFADEIFTSIGEPFHKLSSSATQRRYGKNGHISVNLKTGQWFDFKNNDQSGGPLHLLTKLKGLSFGEALQYGAAWAGVKAAAAPTQTTNSTPVAAEEDVEAPNQAKIAKAKFLWKLGRSVRGTVAERYLKEHRAIQGAVPSDMKFLPYFKDASAGTSFPCLMVAVRNHQGELTAVQLTFLDAETGSKAQTTVARKSIGILKGGFVMIQKGQPGSPIFVAEGVETALSIKEAGSKGTIIASLGLWNLKHISPQNLGTPVVFCADHDAEDSPAAKALEGSVKSLQRKGYRVHVRKPSKVDEDFNDVLRNEGPEAVRAYFTRAA